MWKVISKHKGYLGSVRSATKDTGNYTWVSPYKTKKQAEAKAAKLRENGTAVSVEVVKA